MCCKIVLQLSLAVLMIATAVYGQNCANLPEGTFMPDPASCAHYYRCIHGSPMRHSCPVGTHWSQNLVTCDHIGNVNCDSQAPPTIAPPPTCGPATCGPTPVPTQPTTTPTTAAPGTGPSCVGKPENGVIPHSTNCRAYFQCTNNVAILNNCPDNLYFDYIGQYCTFQSLAQCYQTI